MAGDFKTTLERFWGHLAPKRGAMLGSKNVLDMLKSEKIDAENHTERDTEKTTQQTPKMEIRRPPIRDSRLPLSLLKLPLF